ncbi:hypothetical protein EDD16DRAFT_1633837 [Pisolithus croceorrhizus]|nr:hypothetical protein EV401DRAFT_2022548 [Pisolithus croceorrhizus]KAI6105145.1 hypothetical protein EDD16DRAFT_1633837 [Pisolithus croceorrhizus]KAI6165476.1 hypothetical protein EDD17DRAFT_1555030 [Pisolithus thermaeus]
MELGVNFAARLEPFLLMSKSAKGAAAAKLIQDATAAPGVFVFAELLDMPNVQELSTNKQFGSYFSLLQLFSYRTYRYYLEKKDSFPPLNSAQTTKLKYLSIVSLASERRILPYSLLLEELQMPTIRELEDLIIDAIYLDILRGKFDQKEQQLEIEYTMGRDLEPGQLERVLVALQNWASTTASVLDALDKKLVEAAEHHKSVRAEIELHEELCTANLKEVQERLKESKQPSRKTGPYPGGSGAGDSMDVDDPPVEGNVKIRNRNRGLSEVAAAKQQRKRNRF